MNPKPKLGSMDGTARKLHSDGLTDGEMAAIMGIDKASVASWRSRSGLPPNKKIKHRRRKDKHDKPDVS